MSLTLAAIDAPNAVITPLVTSPFLRHPLISANAMCSLQDFSGGRAVLGLATGGSTVLAIGRRQATQSEIRAEIAAHKALFAGEGIVWEGHPVKKLRFPRRVPIYYSAFGPKALALAGELADGVILFAGATHLDQLAAKIKAVRTSAEAAGRDPAEVDIWAMSYIAVRPTGEEAVNDVLAFIAVNAMAMRSPEALAAVPAQYRAAMEHLQSHYDASEHVVVGGPNVALMQQLGLTDFLADFDTTLGSVSMVTDVLRQMEAMGVSTVLAPLPGHADPLATLHGLKAARDAM